MKKSILWIALASLLQSAFAAVPAEPTAGDSTPKPSTPQLPTGAKSATKAELDAIRTQNALDAERQKGRGAMTGAPSASGPSVPSLSGGVGVEPIPVISGGRPSSGTSIASARVTMVAGAQGQLLATIQTNNGTVVAQEGERITGLGTVKRIAVNQVIIEDGKKTLSIPFAAEPTSNLIQGPNSAAMTAIMNGGK